MDATLIHPRMYVIGSDGECVGTVASVKDREIRLAETQLASGGGRHISLDCAHSVEGDRVWLFVPSRAVLAAGRTRAGAQA